MPLNFASYTFDLIQLFTFFLVCVYINLDLCECCSFLLAEENILVGVFFGVVFIYLLLVRPTYHSNISLGIMKFVAGLVLRGKKSGIVNIFPPLYI